MKVKVLYFHLISCLLQRKVQSKEPANEEVSCFVFTEKGQVYKQKKPTMYPPWSTTFDAHIHRGRIMHVMVKDRTAELKSEATVALDSLATRCKKENGKLEIWVSAESSAVWLKYPDGPTHFWVKTPNV